MVKFIKKNILNLTPMGVLGFHPTKLPQNRGRHPLIWALALGLKKCLNIFFMDEGADSGDILSQKDFDISHNDDAKTLYDKVVEIALEQIAQFFPSLKKKIIKQLYKTMKIIIIGEKELYLMVKLIFVCQV